MLFSFQHETNKFHYRLRIQAAQERMSIDIMRHGPNFSILRYRHLMQYGESFKSYLFVGLIGKVNFQ